MKYLKTIVENKQEEFWLLIYDDLNDHIHSYLFYDFNSLESYGLDIINTERKEFEDESYDEEEMYFTDLWNAVEWCNDNFKDIQITYKKIKPIEHFDKKLQTIKNIGKDAYYSGKKYNL
jgi:hypothetical protein